MLTDSVGYDRVSRAWPDAIRKDRMRPTGIPGCFLLQQDFLDITDDVSYIAIRKKDGLIELQSHVPSGTFRSDRPIGTLDQNHPPGGIVKYYDDPNGLNAAGKRIAGS